MLHYPTPLHKEASTAIFEFFSTKSLVDTILIVNSQARNQSNPESDLDMAILLKPDANAFRVELENEWKHFCEENKLLQKFRKQSPFAWIHLDIIDGHYTIPAIEPGVDADGFELEIGNQLVYAHAPLGEGNYFSALRKQWLPYYDDTLRHQRSTEIFSSVKTDLLHVSSYLQRKETIHAFFIFQQALRKYLQLLFIQERKYPIAYNKWLDYQFKEILQKPELYAITASLFLGGFESLKQQQNATETLKELLHRLSFNQ